jgi:hypothetical protein
MEDFAGGAGGGLELCRENHQHVMLSNGGGTSVYWKLGDIGGNFGSGHLAVFVTDLVRAQTSSLPVT